MLFVACYCNQTHFLRNILENVFLIDSEPAQSVLYGGGISICIQPITDEENVGVGSQWHRVWLKRFVFDGGHVEFRVL